MKGFQPLSSQRIREILSSPGNFRGNEEEVCRQLVGELSKEEREHFARRSYTYWYAVMTDGSLPDKTVMRVAAREALPIYRGKKHDYAKALANMRSIVNFRKEYQLDLMRCCFAGDLSKFGLSLTDQKTVMQMEKMIETELERHPTFISGHDEEGQANLHRLVRRDAEVDEDEFVLGALYVAERALTSTEIISKGKTHQINCIFHQDGYKCSLAPPASAMKRVAKLLAQLYPGQCNDVFILDAPLWARAAYKVISVLLPSDTRSKVRLTSARSEKVRAYMPQVDLSNINIKHTLYDVPFHCLYQSTMSVAQ